ncbi:MAG TPA: hypothetical protein VN441_14700 [Syntrophomonas sp.]|jgi:hypothetical protein|nr:hypothetical protein [Syntrophomonas sp.]
MAAYAGYEFYTDVYKGNALTEYDFGRLILRASTYLDRITGSQSASYTPAESVSMAACAVAEAWQVNEQGGEVTSQSVGSWSKSFAQKKPKTDDQRLLDAAMLYLPSIVRAVRWC